LVLPLGLYATSRVLTLVAAAFTAGLRPRLTIAKVLTAWDGAWYLKIVDHGYPSHIPAKDGIAVYSQVPFFPLYPGIVEVVHWFSPFSSKVTAICVAIFFGALATCAVWLLARAMFDHDTANRAAALFCFLPGAWVFTFAYSEGVMILLAVGTLWALQQRRWLAAGVLGALATASRPNAVVLVLCAVWAAAWAIWKRREWRALIAPILTPLGTVGFFGYLWAHTGEADAWFRVQREAWGERTDFGKSSGHILRIFFTDPFQRDDFIIIGSTILLTALMLFFLLRARLPGIYNIFTLGVLAVAATSAVLMPRPRFVLVAFPLVIATAAYVKRNGFLLLVAGGGAAMAILVVFYGFSFGPLSPIPP
jgi:hypothetical protein